MMFVLQLHLLECERRSEPRYYLTCLTPGRGIGRKAPRTWTQMRPRVERGDVSSNEVGAFATSVRRQYCRLVKDTARIGMMVRRAAARSEGIVSSPGRRLTVGDAALFSELGFLRRIRRARPGSGVMWCSEAVAGMHNNGPRFDSRVMRRGGEL